MPAITFNSISLKNFLSFGNKPTHLDLTGDWITVVMGLNLDTGGEESRNGAGKSSILDALAYVIYGKTTRDVSNANLINKLAGKGQGMVVILDFDTDEGSYRIERGEKPSKLKLFRKELDDDADFFLREDKKFVYEVSRASKAETTAEIEKLIGFDIRMFEYLVANTSETIPFMKLPEEKKREIAEKLMGLDMLSVRADELKVERKDLKKQLVAEESAITATEQANARVQTQINDMSSREAAWNDQRTARESELKDKIAKLEGVDIEEQLQILKMVDDLEAEGNRIASERSAASSKVREATRDLSDLTDQIKRKLDDQTKLVEKKVKMDESTCPTCEQHWVPDPSVMEELVESISTYQDEINEARGLVEPAEEAVAEATKGVEAVKAEAIEHDTLVAELDDFTLEFSSIEEASAAGAVLQATKENLDREIAAENPHTESLAGLKNKALTEIDYDSVKNTRLEVEHYNYLVELLTNKDSFLRKAVIQRWLPRLNGRIARNLAILGLPYTVRLNDDLGMTITDQDAAETEFSWGNMSRGQRGRIDLAINAAMRVLNQSTNGALSLLILDEVLDAGLCAQGADDALTMIKETDAKKRVLLITHRQDIASRAESDGGDTITVELKHKVSRIIHSDVYTEDEEAGEEYVPEDFD